MFFCGSSCGLASRDVICMMINHYMTILSIFLVVHIHVFCVAIDYIYIYIYIDDSNIFYHSYLSYLYIQEAITLRWIDRIDLVA